MVDKAISNSMSRLLKSTAIIGATFPPYNASAAEEKATQLPTVTLVGGGSIPNKLSILLISNL